MRTGPPRASMWTVGSGAHGRAAVCVRALWAPQECHLCHGPRAAIRRVRPPSPPPLPPAQMLARARSRYVPHARAHARTHRCPHTCAATSCLATAITSRAHTRGSCPRQYARTAETLSHPPAHICAGIGPHLRRDRPTSAPGLVPARPVRTRLRLGVARGRASLIQLPHVRRLQFQEPP
jgi:hypothetical protein